MIWVWTAVLAVSLVLEAVTQELVCIWFVPGALIGVALSLLGAAQYVQIPVVIIVSLICLVFLRKMLVKQMEKDAWKTKEKDDPKEGKE